MLALAIVAAGCAGTDGGGGGGGGGGAGGGSSTLDPAQCTSLRTQYDALVQDAANRRCTVDADCAWIADGCFDPPFCYTFVNVSARDTANALVDQGKSVCQCTDCLALAPACNNGICGPKQ